MTARARVRRDRLEPEIEAALEPGQFIGDRACFSFVSDLELVEEELAALVATEPASAVALYESFLAGCHEKAEELDDSSGSFGAFVAELFCGWTNARQAAGASPGETAARLLGWIDEDPYGFSVGLERDLAAVLNKAGLAALVQQVRDRLDAGASQSGETSPRSGDYDRRHWAAMLRALHFAQKDVGAYVSLAEETGLTAQDCHAVATMLAARRKYDEALDWVERGIEIQTEAPAGSPASHDLADLRRGLLRRLGREREALASAWADYCRHPSTYSYRDLMKFVPKPDRGAWHEKAIEAAAETDLYSLIGLLLETKEIDRLARVVGCSADDALEQVSHYVLEPAARKLEKTDAAAAARLWRAMGMRILNAGKSKYYAAALRNFGRAKQSYGKAGCEADWEQVVSEVRAKHQRKHSFMPGFERVANGAGPAQEPPFLERAKPRWIASS
jgi:tetratricopeptide (TPR) repeat protein